MEVIQLLVYIFTITAFFAGLDLFSTRPSLNINKTIFPSADCVNRELLQSFYIHEYQFQIPNAIEPLMPDENYLKSKAREGREASIDLAATIRYLEQNESERNNIDNLLKEENFIPRLESSVKDVTTRARQIRVYSKHCINLDRLWEKHQSLIKAKLNTEEYFIFLAALTSARAIDQQLTIKNDGDVALRDVKIHIMAPYREALGSRKDNILHIESLITQILSVYHRYPDFVEIEVPYLGINKTITYRIVTRDKALQTDEIYHAYKENKSIRVGKVVRFGIGVLIILPIIFLLIKFFEQH